MILVPAALSLYGCSKAKLGTIHNIEMSDCTRSEPSIFIELDDGRHILAIRGERKDGQVFGGKRVKVVPIDGTRCWQVVQYLE